MSSWVLSFSSRLSARWGTPGRREPSAGRSRSALPSPTTRSTLVRRRCWLRASPSACAGKPPSPDRRAQTRHARWLSGSASKISGTARLPVRRLSRALGSAPGARLRPLLTRSSESALTAGLPRALLILERHHGLAHARGLGLDRSREACHEHRPPAAVERSGCNAGSNGYDGFIWNQYPVRGVPDRSTRAAGWYP